MKLKKFVPEVKGFTLIEMLASLTVAGILMGIAIPKFSQLLPGIRLSSAARQVATDLQLARMRAISQHVNQTVVFDTTTATYTFGAADTRNLSQLYPGTTITGVSAGNPTFTTTGTATAQTTITLSNQGVTKQIQVANIGRVIIP
jgi:prepilin-type N-terminal cleavage/methylation domain-containing protein